MGEDSPFRVRVESFAKEPRREHENGRVKVVPASPRFAARFCVVVAGLATACGAARPSPHGAVASAAAAKAPTSADRKGPATQELDRGLSLSDGRGKGDLDRAIADLAWRAEQAGFTDLGVLVDLSARQIERSALEADEDAARDLASAEANLARVLAIDEHSPSAANQLALVHLAKAKRLGRAELERAMGVCLWATRENPTFAPLQNTVGLVELELRDVAGAIQSFEAAIRLDPSYFEAQTNLGASLLFARKFEDAERVYDRMIAERPEYAKEIRLAKQRVRDLGGAAP